MKIKTKKNIYKLLFLIIILLSGLLVYKNYFIPKPKPIIKEVVKMSPRIPTEEEKKLKELDAVHERLKFFKIRYLDKYLVYKEKNPKLSNEQIIINVNIGLDKPFFKDPLNSINKHEKTVIANKYYFLGSNYIPKNLTAISKKCAFNNQRLEKEAADAFEKLCSAAINEGLLIKIRSSYRSFNTQKNLYNNYSKTSGSADADKYSARPGYSEHQTGLAVDVAGASNNYLTFSKTKEFPWMKKNAHKYGFILRYTEKYIPITGYISEPWHYRYVGVEIATYIHENPMSYEEYFVRFIDI